MSSRIRLFLVMAVVGCSLVADSPPAQAREVPWQDGAEGAWLALTGLAYQPTSAFVAYPSSFQTITSTMCLDKATDEKTVAFGSVAVVHSQDDPFGSASVWTFPPDVTGSPEAASVYAKSSFVVVEMNDLWGNKRFVAAFAVDATWTTGLEQVRLLYLRPFFLANDALEATEFASAYALTPDSGISGGLPPSNYAPDDVPPDDYRMPRPASVRPQPGDKVIPSFSTSPLWTDLALKCWDEYQDDKRASFNEFEVEYNQCTLWSSMNFFSGGGAGAAIGACGLGFGGAPVGFVAGGVAGMILGRAECRTSAQSGWNTRWKQAWDEYIDCLTAAGIAIP